MGGIAGSFAGVLRAAEVGVFDQLYASIATLADDEAETILFGGDQQRKMRAQGLKLCSSDDAKHPAWAGVDLVGHGRVGFRLSDTGHPCARFDN